MRSCVPGPPSASCMPSRWCSHINWRRRQLACSMLNGPARGAADPTATYAPEPDSRIPWLSDALLGRLRTWCPPWATGPRADAGDGDDLATDVHVPPGTFMAAASAYLAHGLRNEVIAGSERAQKCASLTREVCLSICHLFLSFLPIVLVKRRDKPDGFWSTGERSLF